MRILIVDDENKDLEHLRQLVCELRPESFISAFSDVWDALAELDREVYDVALLDIAVPEMGGLEFAMECKSRCPKINLIFATAHPEFAAEAFKLRASGYLLKPIVKDELEKELENLRYPVMNSGRPKPYIQTFGNFELFVDGKPVNFHRSKGKEILAYLTDRRGASVTTRELAAVLWEDRVFDFKMSKNLSNIIAEMFNDLRAVEADNIVGKRRGELFLFPDNVDCDYYRYLEGDEQAVASFHDEYMTQFAWSEYTLGSLLDD